MELDGYEVFSDYFPALLIIIVLTLLQRVVTRKLTHYV